MATIQQDLLALGGFETAFMGRVTDAEDFALRSDYVALRLHARGVGPGSCVAVWMERSDRALTVMTGILKAGAALVPLNADIPPRRAEAIAEICQASLVRNGDFDALCAPVDGTTDDLPRAGESDTALILFTSGSTGNPKGACHTQAHMSLLTRRYAELLRQADAVCRYVVSDTELSFMSFWEYELGPALHLTGRICVTGGPDGRSLSSVADALEESGGILFMTPSKCAAYLNDAAIKPRFRRLSVILLAGERLDPELAHRLIAHCESTVLYTTYGSTECGMIAIQRLGLTGLQPVIPLVIVSEEGLRCPEGELGEICVDAAHAFTRYIGEGERRTVQIDGREYLRTGDMGTLKNGELDIRGRRDQMIKLHGMRVELGEIEHAIRTFPGVDNCAVVYANNVLSAWCASKSPIDPAALRAYLSETLPYYMVPAGFVFMEQLPLNANGKIDRARLKREAKDTTFVRETSIAEEDDRTKPLTSAAEEVLGFPVSPSDSLTALGMDSLRGLNLANFLEQRGYGLRVGDIMLHPVVADLARYMRRLEPPAPSGAPALGRRFRVENYFEWFVLTSEASGRPAARVEEVFLARCDIDEAALMGRVKAISARHPALRSVFTLESGGRFAQTFSADSCVDVRFYDISYLRDRDAGGIDPRQRNYIRFFLGLQRQDRRDAKPMIACFRLGGGYCAFVLSFSHAISDGYSKALIKAELLGALPGREGEDAYIAYQDFVHSPEVRKASRAFFQAYLKGATPAAAPVSPGHMTRSEFETRTARLGPVSGVPEGITPFAYAAWRYGRAALRLFGAKRIAFMVTSSGRSIPVEDIGATVGCLAYRMPVALDADMSPTAFIEGLYEAERHLCMTPEELFGTPLPSITLPSLVVDEFPDMTGGLDLGEIVPFVHEPNDFNCYFTTDGGAIRVRFDYHAEPEQRAFYQRLIALLEEPAEC